jgi:nitroreductase
MDFFEVINSRHSVRKYAGTPVEEEKLKTILNTCTKAPSTVDLQGYDIFIVRSLEQRQELAKAAHGQGFLTEAPVVLVFCANPARSAIWYKKRGETLYSVQEATIACTYAMLTAKALGLDTVWVGGFEEDEIQAILHIPLNLRPVAILPVGYAAKQSDVRSRRDPDEHVHEVK